jgi:two-component system, response regulator YesN
MFKLLREKKESIILNWLLSYTIFLVLFVIVSIGMYLNTEKIIEQEINKANNLLLKQIRYSMDNILDNARRLSVEIMLNPRVQSVTNYRGELNGVQYYEFRNLVMDLRAYKASNASITNLYILLNNVNTAISSEHVSSIETFYSINFDNKKETYEAWIKQFREDAAEKYFISYGNTEGANRKKINYVHGLSTIDTKSLSSAVVVSIDEKTFLEHASEIELATMGTLFILDENNNVVISTKSMKYFENFNPNELIDSTGVIYKKIKGDKLVISHINSGINGWKYVSIIPEKVYLKKIHYARNMTMGLAVTSILLAIVFIYIFIKRNYSSIKKLINLFRDNEDENGSNTGNEYVYIEGAISKTLKNNKDIKAQLNSQRELLGKSFLERLLKGHAQGEIPEYEALHSFDINFPGANFTVMLLFLEETDVSSLNEANNKQKYGNDLKFIFSNIFNDLCTSSNKSILVDVDGVMACILNSFENNSQLRLDLIKTVNRAQEFIKEHFDIEFTVSISCVHETAGELSVCYKEALHAMNYMRTLGIKETIFYEDIKNQAQGSYFYPINKEQQLINFIKSGEYIGARLTVEELFNVNINKNHISVDLAQCLMLNLVSTMLRTVNELTNVCDENFLIKFNPIGRLLPCKTVEQMKLELDKFLLELCSYMKELNNCNSNWIINEVVPFIHQNYKDINLSISSIADNFNMHPVYISKAFKNQVGEGLLDYITKIRIDKSKGLLKKENSANIEDIALQVGYTCSKTFTRAFKKYEGITPGKYKEILS